MSKDFRSIAFLYGQLTSTVLLIVLVWAFEEPEKLLEFLNKIGISIYAFKIFSSLCILLGGVFLVYKNIKEMLEHSKNQKEDSE